MFKYEGYRVVVSPEALFIKPFRNIWKRDRSENKERAMNELAFIYFLCDPKSDYQFIIDEEERLEVIKEDQGFKESWKPDKLIMDAVEYYKSIKSTASLLLGDTRLLIDKLRTHLKNIDLDAKDDKGRPLYTMQMVTATISKIPELITKLDEAEKALSKEEIDNSRMRGSGEKTILEDGIL